MFDLLPLDLGAWAAGHAERWEAPARAGAFTLMLEVAAGDDLWQEQLPRVASALEGKPHVTVVIYAPGWQHSALQAALTAVLPQPGFEPLLVSTRLADAERAELLQVCQGFLESGSARHAFEARLAGVPVVAADDRHALQALYAGWQAHQPPAGPADSRSQQALYLADQVRRHRGDAQVLVVGDELLAAELLQLPGVRQGSHDPHAPLLDLVVVAGLVPLPEALVSRIAPAGLLLHENPDAAGPDDFDALDDSGWQVLRRGPGSAALLPHPIRRVLVTYVNRPETTALHFCRALRGLGYQVEVAGAGLDQVGGRRLAAGDSLPALLEGFEPHHAPELVIHLAFDTGDLPPRGLDRLEVPSLGYFLTEPVPGLARQDNATIARFFTERAPELERLRDFDHAGISDGMSVDALIQAGHPRVFFLPGILDLDELAPAGQAQRLRAIALLARVQGMPSRGLSLLAGHQLFAAGSIEQAVGRFEEAARGPRPSIEALINLGACMHALGNPEAAIALFKAALARDPASQGARENLAALSPELQAPPAASSSLLTRDVPPYYRWVRPEIIGLIPPDVTRVLDVGCAAGALGEMLKQSKPGLEVVGIETDQLAAIHAAKRLDAVLQGSVEAMPLPFPPGYFDCLVLADVLEHLVNPEQALERLLPLLRAGGHLVISLPNIRHYEVVGELFATGRFTYQDAGILDRTHLRFYTYTEIVQWMHRAGLELVGLGANLGVADPARLLALQQAVESLGGSGTSFRNEGAVIQYLLRLRKPAAGQEVALGASRPAERLPLAPVDAAPVASLVVLTLNQLPYTRQCLDSVFAHASLPLELIVVDNGSTDGTCAYLRHLARQDPRVKVIFNDTNLGFAHGCNQGIVNAAGEFVVLLNNDTVVTAGWLEGLVAPMLRSPDIGAVGPSTNRIFGAQCLPFVPYGDDLEAMQAFAAWLRHHTAGQGRALIRLTGFCMAIRRAALARIGGLDTRFAIGNFEDDDLGLRLQTAGYRLWHSGETFVHHYGGVTFRGESVAYSETLAQNWGRFGKKWSVDPARPYSEGYLNSVVDVPFEPSRDVFPILVKEAPPFPLDAPRGFHFLAMPDWAKLEPVMGAIAAYAEAFTAQDDVSLLLWVDPQGPHDLADVAERLGAALAAAGLDNPDSPDLTLFDAPGGPLELARVFATAQAFLPLGFEAPGDAARACGLQVIEVIEAPALRAACALSPTF